LQRYLVDFASEVPFETVQAKWLEHHGVEVVVSTIRPLGQLAGWSGLKPSSRVYGLGDGAPWIAEPMEIQFGAQGSYLIDFYHLCDYLAAAAPHCSQTPQAWLEEPKARFLSGRNAEVSSMLKQHIEPEGQAETPVRNAYRYLSNRPGQFDSLAAIKAPSRSP
jgi:hypothetical protein